jgi:hypothetical protein
MGKSDEWEEYKRNRYSANSNKEGVDLAKKLKLVDKAFRKSKWKNLT